MYFYFRIAADAGYAHDEDGNPAECYACLGGDQPLRDGADVAETQQRVREALATLANCDIEHITPISMAEFLACSEEIDDE